jgi:hypothetical protein
LADRKFRNGQDNLVGRPRLIEQRFESRLEPSDSIGQCRQGNDRSTLFGTIWIGKDVLNECLLPLALPLKVK